MTSSHLKPQQISAELKHISLKKHQLLEKKKMHGLVEELRSRCVFGQTAAASNEAYSIDEEVKQLTERELELQKRLDEIVSAGDGENDKKEVSELSSPKPDPVGPALSSNVFFVEAPPIFPAPKVYLDLENLPPSPCRTQCPECREFVLTETSTSMTSISWLACVSIACLGGVVGCCLIPFCYKRFKSTKHKCPKCRSSIQNTQTLRGEAVSERVETLVGWH